MIKGVLRSCLVLMPYQWHKTWSRCTTRCKKMSSALPPHSALRPSCMGLGSSIKFEDVEIRIFFVPQRIHMVSGSLWDQISYPDKIGVLEPTKQAELQAVLDLVGVGYLIERWKDDSSHVEDPEKVLAAIAHGTYCKCQVCQQAAGEQNGLSPLFMN
jgi:hypothetical protein